MTWMGGGTGRPDRAAARASACSMARESGPPDTAASTGVIRSPSGPCATMRQGPRSAASTAPSTRRRIMTSGLRTIAPMAGSGTPRAEVPHPPHAVGRRPRRCGRGRRQDHRRGLSRPDETLLLRGVLDELVRLHVRAQGVEIALLRLQRRDLTPELILITGQLILGHRVARDRDSEVSDDEHGRHEQHAAWTEAGQQLSASLAL